MSRDTLTAIADIRFHIVNFIDVTPPAGVSYVHTDFADILTKPLQGPLFFKLRALILGHALP